MGQGFHTMKLSPGRIPLNRQGTRAAADGVYPSYFEPGRGYTDSMYNSGAGKFNFGTQLEQEGVAGEEEGVRNGAGFVEHRDRGGIVREELGEDARFGLNAIQSKF